MVILFTLFAGLTVSIIVWFLCKHLLRAGFSYKANLSSETKQTLDDVFLFLDIKKLIPVVLLAVFLSMLLMVWLIGRWWGILPIFIGILFLPRIILVYMRKQRNNYFDRQLPDFLMALSGSVKSGASLQQSLQNVVSQAKGPVAQEFSLLLREQRLGIDFTQALSKLLARVPTESCALVVSALNLSALTGGSLASTLENIAFTLYARNHWSGRVKALTAQGRMQSLIMALLPFLLFIILQYLEPEAMSLLWQTWYGWLVLVTILLMESIGIFWIYKIANIRI